MKILWIKTDFLHPTNRGGQIRTLEIVRNLHQRHEVHYLAYDNPSLPEGLNRSGEYCTKAYPIPHHVPPRRSLAFARQLAANVFSPLPLSVTRYYSKAMSNEANRLIASVPFDSIVCDFLFPAVNIKALERCVLFQHNVESVIWQRHASHAPDPLRRAYFGVQAARMQRFETTVCKRSRHVIAVSETDAALLRAEYSATRVSTIPTGVDLDYFARPASTSPQADLVFVGSMDWMPNIDGMRYFMQEIYPILHARRPQTTIAIVGRAPTPEIKAYAQQFPNITVTGTVPDVRPFLWGAAVSIVPLRIGGGTRLKIYEAMAACLPVVSTTVGAEGLCIDPPHNIRIADTPQLFAEQCIQLLENQAEATAITLKAHSMVSAQFSSQQVSTVFENILEQARQAQ